MSKVQSNNPTTGLSISSTIEQEVPNSLNDNPQAHWSVNHQAQVRSGAGAQVNNHSTNDTIALAHLTTYCYK